MFNAVNKLHVKGVNKLKCLRAERKSINNPLNLSFPHILPHELSTLRPKEFNDVLRAQNYRVIGTFGDRMVVKIEDGFKKFKMHVQSSVNAQQNLFVTSRHVLSHSSLFKTVREPFRIKNTCFHIFCSGLETAFPVTATVESYFSALQWEEDPSDRKSVV